eukprot:4094684-Lingulodinium_polyedra.AAC.1
MVFAVIAIMFDLGGEMLNNLRSLARSVERTRVVDLHALAALVLIERCNSIEWCFHRALICTESTCMLALAHARLENCAECSPPSNLKR